MGFGDALMDSGAARALQHRDQRQVRIQHQHKVVWSEVWEHNPRLARPHECGEFQILYARSLAANMRPYHRARDDRRWTYNLDFRAQVGELYFSEHERNMASVHSPQIVIEPTIKPRASPNKDWGWMRWHEFARLALQAGLSLYQLGSRKSTPRLQGAQLIETFNFRMACAVLSRAKAYVGHEGGLHHAAAALGIPGVVVFGGFTPIELTGYQMHRNLGVSLGDACGMRVPCEHCAREMERITPEQVLRELMAVM